MVARKWDWDIIHMITHFGSKSTLAIFISTLATAFTLKKNLKDRFIFKLKNLISLILQSG